MRATLSLYGILAIDPTVFDNFVVPDSLDKENIINSILMETMDMELLYANPQYLKMAIGTWSALNLPVWQHLYATTQYEYNPINNYDRTEEHTWTENTENKLNTSAGETRTGEMKENGEYTRDNDVTRNSNGEGSSTETGEASKTTGEDSTTLTDKAAYNSTEYDPVDKVTVSRESTEKTNTSSEISNKSESKETENAKETGGNNNTRNTTDKTTRNEDKTENESVERHETITAYGNIGVTTTQQMIEQEREIATFNVAQMIIDGFIDKFCLLVY